MHNVTLFWITVKIILFSALGSQLLASQTWTDTDGNTMQATFIETVELNGATTVIFSREGIRYQVPLARLSEADQQRILSGNAREPVADTTSSAARELTAFERTARTGLKKLERGKLVDAELGDKPLEWYAFYFSAGWCGPCRNFTPELVTFYNRFKRRNPNFEIIFISSDHTPEDMEQYMKDYKMTFPTYPHREVPAQIARLRGRGIPCLVFATKDGKILADSYTSDGQYNGPRSVLAEMEKTLK